MKKRSLYVVILTVFLFAHMVFPVAAAEDDTMFQQTAAASTAWVVVAVIMGLIVTADAIIGSIYLKKSNNFTPKWIKITFAVSAVVLVITVVGFILTRPSITTDIPKQSEGENLDYSTNTTKDQTENTLNINIEESTSTSTEETTMPTVEENNTPAGGETTVSGNKSEGGKNTTPTTSNTDNTNNTKEENLIAEGKWDGGPIIWKITTDGVLTISGNRSVQESSSYIWRDTYADVITRIVIEDGVTNVPQEAFKGMSKVTSVYLGEGLKTIEENAFQYCTALQSVTFPASLEEILGYAFFGCTGLKRASFADNGSLRIIEQSAFSKSGLTEFICPSSMRTIESYAFKECKELETVVLQGGVKKIHAKAFMTCTGLKELILGASITEFDAGVFEGCNAFEKVEIYTSVGHKIFEEQRNLTSVVIGGNAVKVHDFSGCTALTSVKITASITAVGAHAFENCSSLKEISLPDTVKIIGTKAFYKSGITSITIPAGVNEIGMYAFAYCPLQEISFNGNAPESIENTIFSSVTATVYYPADNMSWTEDKRNGYGGTLTWIAK